MWKNWRDISEILFSCFIEDAFNTEVIICFWLQKLIVRYTMEFVSIF